MKKQFFKVAVLAAFAIIAGLNVYEAQTEIQLSEYLSRNVEALASVKPITSTHTCVHDGIYCALYLDGVMVFESDFFYPKFQ